MRERKKILLCLFGLIQTISTGHCQTLPLKSPVGFRSPDGPCTIFDSQNNSNQISVMPKTMDVGKDAAKSPTVVLNGPNGSLTISTDTQQTVYADFTKNDETGSPLLTWGKATPQQMNIAVNSIQFCGKLPVTGQPAPRPTPEYLKSEMDRAKEILKNTPNQPSATN